MIWMACIFACLALVVGVAAYLGYRQAQKFINQFAQKDPITLPSVHYSQAEMQAVQQRIDDFLVGARTGKANIQLSLSANDLNALVAESWMSNRVYVTLQSNAVWSQFSIPFEQLGMPLFSGRYLNGSGTLDVGCRSGSLVVSLKDASVNGIGLPEHYLEWIRKQNFVRNLATNEMTMESLGRVARVGVVSDRLVFELKSPETDSR